MTRPLSTVALAKRRGWRRFNPRSWCRGNITVQRIRFGRRWNRYRNGRLTFDSLRPYPTLRAALEAAG